MKTLILKIHSHCQFRDFSDFFHLKNSNQIMHGINEFKIDSTCAEYFSLSSDALSMIFRPLDQKLFGQTTKCGQWAQMG